MAAEVRGELVVVDLEVELLAELSGGLPAAAMGRIARLSSSGYSRLRLTFDSSGRITSAKLLPFSTAYRKQAEHG